jgi:hypothetical protein
MNLDITCTVLALSFVYFMTTVPALVLLCVALCPILMTEVRTEHNDVDEFIVNVSQFEHVRH